MNMMDASYDLRMAFREALIAAYLHKKSAPYIVPSDFDGDLFRWKKCKDWNTALATIEKAVDRRFEMLAGHLTKESPVGSMLVSGHDHHEDTTPEEVRESAYRRGFQHGFCFLHEQLPKAFAGRLNPALFDLWATKIADWRFRLGVYRADRSTVQRPPRFFQGGIKSDSKQRKLGNLKAGFRKLDRFADL